MIGEMNTYQGTITYNIVKVSDIPDIELTENGKGTLGSNMPNIVEMAAIGGTLFGNVGAIVEAIAGMESKKISDVSLVLAVNDLATPYIQLQFLSKPWTAATLNI